MTPRQSNIVKQLKSLPAIVLYISTLSTAVGVSTGAVQSCLGYLVTPTIEKYIGDGNRYTVDLIRQELRSEFLKEREIQSALNPRYRAVRDSIEKDKADLAKGNLW